MTRQAKIKVTGIVQGVYYRAETRQKAQELGLVGVVRNLPDGSVEIVCEGNDELIEGLIAWSRRGPDLAYVESVDVEWLESSGAFKSFSIAY
jgi:acylphosphatase